MTVSEKTLQLRSTVYTIFIVAPTLSLLYIKMQQDHLATTVIIQNFINLKEIEVMGF